MDPIIALLIMAVLAGAIAGSFVFLSAILGPKKRTPLKDEPFECGVESDGMPRTPMPVKVYLTALLLILFDVELAFVFTGLVVFRGLGWFGFVDMRVFLVIGGVGLFY